MYERFPASQELHTHGFLPSLPRDLSAHKPLTQSPPPVLTADIPVPDTELSRAVDAAAKEALDTPTYNHSMRVYYLLSILAQHHFPDVKIASETLFLTALLHDLGTTLGETAMSFEFAGGIRARELVLESGGNAVQADSIAEAIIRHQDEGSEGTLSALGVLIQIATLLDNTGRFADWVQRGTYDDVVARWPREGWSGCFANFLRKEGQKKPWCHTTKVGCEEFASKIEGNKLGKSYEMTGDEPVA